ncbi:uncharacterized protein LOC117393438 isoform X2 [Periophthalmus magnuspinnatus]|uniref:uncharacterized protein LOC117393438 isoform X2 n=1 Tax=Periophthalmus magnuspinnatus TaxID=409849 RepID=UPI0024367106|nr:uncharacterized protein LOC117393438 isoform X2 [Periophthalmus magnuspinnatus]
MFDAIVEHLKEKENPFDLETELKKLSEDSDGDDLTFIKEMINGPDEKGHYKGRPDKHFFYEIVANETTGIDVDKFDYFARDCHHLGIKNSFDHNRYIKFARVLKVDGQWQICTRKKEVSNIYEMFHTRSSLHRKAYQHKTNKAIELMIRDALLKADPVLKMSEAIKDIADKTMEEYTQLTDSIFEKILYSTGEKLKEAREILQNILSRKLYRFLGETKLTDKLREEKEEKWKSDLAEMSEKPLKKDDFEISVATFNFGQKDKNPMDNLYIYYKSNNEKAFKIPSEQVSQFLLPNKFSEEWIRVYCTSLDENTLKVAKKSFYEWCTKNNLPPPTLPQLPTADPQPKVFNDPIHGQMEFHPILVKIIDTPQFQRLRYLKQLGGAYFVYPGASHNRFEHSLGVAHLAGKLVRHLKEKQQGLGITDRDVLCVEIAGLCHDLGHGPFSHLFDNMFIPKTQQNKEWKHEKGSAAMFDAIVEHLKKKKENPFDLETELKKLSEDSDGDDLSFIKEMINGPDKEGHYKGRPSNKSFLYEIVANKRTGLDVDKFDYFARDCHHLGIKNSFDHNRYIKFARVLEVDGQWQICTRDKEVPNIYEMFHTRSSLHRKAYQHKTNKAVELMIRDALLKAEPVLKMSKAIKDIADKTMEEYTQLTDSIFEKILYSTGDELKEAREILQNILSRKLYRFLGETKLTDGFAKEKEEKQISEMAPCETQDNQSPLTKEEKWKSDLAVVTTYKEQKPLTKDDFEITIISFDFGQKDKNPMDNLYVYNKFDNEKAFKIPSEQVSQFLLPNKFSEKWIRVYCTSLDKTTQRVAQKSFYEWCRRKNLHFSPSLPQTPTANPQPKVFNDPIHGHMEFHPILVKIIDTPQFQRLRFIKQMGGAYFVYPGASHNQFEHSLGVAHLAGQFLKSLQKKLPQSIDDQDILCVQIASLCYDLGHGPFSDVFDRIVQNVWPKLKWERKTVSAELFKEIGKSLSLEELSYDNRLFIEEIIQEKETPKGRPKEKHFLYDVVSNKRNAGVGVKLFDSVARDCYYLGLQTNFDHQRFIKFAKVLQVEGKNQICIRDKLMSTMYDLFHTIAALETKAYKHNVTMKIELMQVFTFV